MKRILSLLLPLMVVACSKDDSPTKEAIVDDVGKVSLTIDNPLKTDKGQIGSKGIMQRSDNITDLSGQILTSVETSVLKGYSVNLDASQQSGRAVRIIGVTDYERVTQTEPRKVYIRYFARTPATNENYRILFTAVDQNSNAVQSFLTGSQIEVGLEGIYEASFDVSSTFPSIDQIIDWRTEYRLYSTATDFVAPVLAPEQNNITALLNATDEWECSMGTYIVPHRTNRRSSQDELERQLGQDGQEYARMIIDNNTGLPRYADEIVNRFRGQVFAFNRIEIPPESSLYLSVLVDDLLMGSSSTMIDIPLYDSPTSTSPVRTWSQEISIPGVGFGGEENRLFVIAACDTKDHFTVTPDPVTVDCSLPETPALPFPDQYEVKFLNNPERPGEEYTFWPVTAGTTEFDIPLGTWDVQVQNAPPEDQPVISYSDYVWLIDYDAAVDFRTTKTFTSEVYTFNAAILVAKKNHSQTTPPAILKESTNASTSITVDLGDYWATFPIVNDINTNYTLEFYDERGDPYTWYGAIDAGQIYRFIVCPRNEVGITTESTLFQDVTDTTLGQKFIQ